MAVPQALRRAARFDSLRRRPAAMPDLNFQKGMMMRKVFLPLAAVALFGVAACSEKAQDETSEAAGALGNDIEATMDEAAADVDAAADDAAADGASRTAVNAADASGDAVENAGDATEAAAEDAAH